MNLQAVWNQKLTMLFFSSFFPSKPPDVTFLSRLTLNLKRFIQEKEGCGDCMSENQKGGSRNNHLVFAFVVSQGKAEKQRDHVNIQHSNVLPQL